jgi:methyl-accepting chemotaxis protein
VLKQSADLDGLTTTAANEIEEMSSGATQIRSAAQRVSEISTANKDHVTELGGVVLKFKV